MAIQNIDELDYRRAWHRASYVVNASDEPTEISHCKLGGPGDQPLPGFTPNNNLAYRSMLSVILSATSVDNVAKLAVANSFSFCVTWSCTNASLSSCCAMANTNTSNASMGASQYHFEQSICSAATAPIAARIPIFVVDPKRTKWDGPFGVP